MSKPSILPVLALLAGCATPVAMTAPDGAIATGALTLAWLEPHAMEVRLDGKRYVGDWTSTPCFTDECRGDYRNVLRIHRRHIRQGEATLSAPDGSRLVCRWVSHLPQVEGTCTASDGRQFRLKDA